jgi:Zn finger protein HypA/HybF involved in hydrogenase expression
MDKIEAECVECEATFPITQEMMENFQSEEASELYCPGCQHQKHFGVIHSE